MRLAGDLQGPALDEVQRIMAVQEAVGVAVRAWRARDVPVE